MKTKTFRLLGALFIFTAAYFIIAGFSKKENYAPPLQVSYTPAPPQKNFINMIFNSSYSTGEADMFVDNFLPRIKNELHFDYIHAYGKKEEPTKYATFGALLQQYQKDSTNALYSRINSAGLKLLGGRINVENMCYAQRMIYEIPAYNNDISTNDGFCYKNYRGIPETDNGRTVLHACADNCPDQDNSSAGYILENIYENLQFGDLFDFTQADIGTWYIKPVMKIPTGLDPETDIVRIDVVNYEGTTILQVPIKAKSFGQSYNGGYVNNYVLLSEPLEVSGNKTPNGTGLNAGVDNGNWVNWPSECQIDFKIYWYGNADVWVDKMIVDDENGNDLFTQRFDDVIKEEASEFANNAANYSFFTDELPYSNWLAARYVDSLLKVGNPSSSFHAALSNYHNTRGCKNNNLAYKPFFENVHPKSVNVDAHEIFFTRVPYQFNNINSKMTSDWSSVSNYQYNQELQKQCFGDDDAIVTEGVWGSHTDPKPRPWGSLIHQVKVVRDQRDLYSPDTKIIMQPQIHAFLDYDENLDIYTNLAREPTNEEIQAQAMLCIAHGADGICWFWHPSIRWPKQSTTQYRGLSQYFDLENPESHDQYLVSIGLTNIFGEDSSPQNGRTTNLYGQNKFQYVADMNLKIQNWKYTLDHTNWQAGYSVHSQGADHGFIKDIVSTDPYNNANINCITDNPAADCETERYWEMGFFNPMSTADKSKYVLMVNRRCVPDTLDAGHGENRVLKIKFDPADLTAAVNWKLTDVNNGRIFKIISRNNTSAIDIGSTNGGLGWFKPGEGKLFKLEPVLQSGGVLVDNEETNEEFDCADTVFNNGFDITLSPGAKINFADTAGIVMNGGEFKSGNMLVGAGSPQVELKGAGGTWGGLLLNNCSVDIYATKFEDIKDSAYAVNGLNCNPFKVNSSLFNIEENTGAINGSFAFSVNNEEPPPVTTQVSGNSFVHLAGSTMPVLALFSTGVASVSALISNNSFNVSSAYEPSNAVMLDGLVGGVIKNNTIEDYSTGIIMLASSMDILNNTITANSGISSSTGIFGVSGSMLGMQFESPYFIGGVNRISNMGATSTNIAVDNSNFGIDIGYNTFDIEENPSRSYHLSGIFTGINDYTPRRVRKNCFNQGSISGDDPFNDVIYSMGNDALTFGYEPFACVTDYEAEDHLIVDLGEGVYDTIDISEGMSQIQIPNDRQQITKVSPNSYTENVILSPPQRAKDPSLGQGGYSSGVTTASPQELYNSICLETRKRNYQVVSEKSEEFLENYADSLQALDVIAKYYLASLSTDSAGSKISPLKTLLETLILNHGSNTSLVDKCFYYVQKCKAALGDYQSAMDGFAQIVSQNPGTYEALVASWDYAAVSLMSNGGNGGGVSNPSPRHGGVSPLIGGTKGGQELDELDKLYELDDPRDQYDQSAFTKEDRIAIRTNVVKTYKDKKQKQEEEVKQLEVKAQNGDETAIKQLEVKKVLKEEVKTYRPNTMQEHIQKMNASIQKVFGKTTTGGKPKDTQLPTKFDLSQNYPNPFNPVTKINYELPKDAKVKLIVYDILGREVARLVNNEFRSAGRYIVEFNGSSLSSGVYFYRIETDADPETSSGWTMVKKMVLIK